MRGPTESELSATADRRRLIPIIDDHELFATTLAIALRGEDFDAWTVPVADLPAFLARSGTGGLVLLDLDLRRDAPAHDVDGVDLVEPLQARGWRVLVVTGVSDERAIAAAIAAGAVGYVPKACSFDVLLKIIITAAEGSTVMTESERRQWLERHHRDQVRDREFSRLMSRLTPREREVLELLSAGLRATAVAEHFVVTVATVRTQIRSILTKLEVGSQLEAVALLRGRHPEPPPHTPRTMRT